MRVVVQRVSAASLAIEGQQCACLERGLVVLAGFSPRDTAADLEWMADKIATLRIFTDGQGKMNLSVAEVGGQVLAVPNFTLYGDCRKGRRPGFSDAAPPDLARAHFAHFCRVLGRLVPTQQGVFGAHMHVSLTNDGPVTLLLDSEKTF